MKKLMQTAVALILALAFPIMTLADIYVVGSGTNLTWELPGTKLEADQYGCYTFELNSARSFKFSTIETTDWDEFNLNAYTPLSYFTKDVYSEGGQTLNLEKSDSFDATIWLPWIGDYTLTINLEQMTINAKTTTPEPPFDVYIRGEMNEWYPVEDWKMQYDKENDCYTFDCSENIIPAGCEFKFADDVWNEINLGYDATDFHGLFPVSDITLNLIYNARPLYFLTDFDGHITLKITSPEEAYTVFTASSNEYTKDCFESNGILYKILSESQHTLSAIGIASTNNAPTTIVIPESIDYNGVIYSVEVIGNNAFAYCETIESVTLPESLKSIGRSAFSRCSSLASINIPEKVNSIGSGAFDGCSNLSSINLPKGITAIEDYTFYNCESLTEITLPENITSIGSSAFFGCKSLETVNSYATNPPVCGYGVFSYIPADATLHVPVGTKDAYASATGWSYFSNIIDDLKTEEEEVEDPEPPVALYIRGDINEWNPVEDWKMQYDKENDCYTFDCSDHIIPAKCQFKFADDVWGNINFGYDMSDFNGLFPVSDITLNLIYNSDSIYFLTDFDGHITLKITSGKEAYAIFTASSNECTKNYFESNGILYKILSESHHTLSAIGISSANNAPTTIVIPESIEFNNSAYSVEEIDERAFANCETIESVTLPENVTSIGRYAFWECLNLASIVLPEKVTSIGSDAFGGCSNLASIVLPETVTSIGEFAFYFCSSLTSINLPQGITSIEDGTFYNCTSLTEIVVPEGVTTIGGWAFAYCKSLASINIPQGITSIQDYTFYNCSSLVSITLPENVTSIGSSAFNGCSNLASINIPQGITEINYGTFWGCSSLTEITLPENVSWIGDYAFSGCQSLTSINVAEGNNYYASIDGVLFSKDLRTLIKYPGGRGCEYYSVPKGITSIGNEAFEDCSSFTEITLPENITSIGHSAFSGCSNLASINIPQNVTSIGHGAFGGCSNLASINLPQGITAIEYHTFEGCSSLTEITLPENITSIGFAAFRWCTSLETVNSYATHPPVCGNDVFYEIPSDATLHVPVGTRDAYASAYGWSVFSNIIDDLMIDDDEPDTCVAMSVSDNHVELAVNEEAELTVSLKGLKVGTSTLTLILTDESGEEFTETVFISVVKDTTDVEALFADEEDVLVNIYTLNGILLKTNVRPETVLELPKGIYIVGDKKVLVK